jgi:hypothetical protein
VCQKCWLPNATNKPNYATLDRFLFNGLLHLVLALDPIMPITASDANVKQNASALSGEAKPRFLMSSLLSI